MLGSLSASLLTEQDYDVLCDSSAVFKGVTQNIYVIVCVVTSILSCRALHVSKREREREMENEGSDGSVHMHEPARVAIHFLVLKTIPPNHKAFGTHCHS